jgi:hypothetical protein
VLGQDLSEIAATGAPGEGVVVAGGASGFLFEEEAGPLWHYAADGRRRGRRLARCGDVSLHRARALGADESGYYFLVHDWAYEVILVSPASGCSRVSISRAAGGERAGWGGPEVTITGRAALLVYWRPSEVEGELERYGFLVPDVRALLRGVRVGEPFDLPSDGVFKVLAIWTSADGRPGLLLGGESLSVWSPAGGRTRLSRRRPDTLSPPGPQEPRARGRLTAQARALYVRP